MRIGLIDFDSKLPNVAIMKLAHYYKERGHTVVLNPSGASEVDKTYCSVLFTWNRDKAAKLAALFPNIEFGGTGWDLKTCLPDDIEVGKPDYDLYRVEDIAPRIRGILTAKKRLQKARVLCDAGVGHVQRGCCRACPWCFIPEKEGRLRTVASVGDLLNPRSKVLILLDANLTASPDVLDVLREIRERDVTLDITQGIDIRLVTPEIAAELARIRHLRSIHYSWDSVKDERAIMSGIEILGSFVNRWRHLCFMLVGYNTEFSEDMYRFRRLLEAGVDPYVMVYNHQDDARLRAFARWVNGRIYSACADFEQYTNWAKRRDAYFATPQAGLFAA